MFEANKTRISESVIKISDIHDQQLVEQLGEKPVNQLKDDLELIEGVYGELDKELYLDGLLAPVFFWECN